MTSDGDSRRCPTVDNPFDGAAVHHYACVVSTMDVLRRGVCADAWSVGTVVVADHQTAGRGRRGRSWLEQPGESLLFSIVLFNTPTPGLPLSLAAGLAVARYMESEHGIRCALKWPNDVLTGPSAAAAAKLSGILCETAGEQVLCGIGINLNQQHLPPGLRRPATSVYRETGRGPFVPIDELAPVLQHLRWTLTRCADRPDWGGEQVNARLWARGQWVEYRAADQGEFTPLRIDAVADDGCLSVTTVDRCSHRLVGGEFGAIIREPKYP